MATFEERILEFLDGERSDGAPLDDPSREELLREVSESRDKQRVFTAHLRLRDILATGQKPSSAPLSVQKELAHKLPLLALSLPYLAEERKRNVVAAFWGSQSWIVRSSLIGLTILLAGGLWYSIHSRSTQSTVTSESRTSTSVSSSAGLNASSNPGAISDQSTTASRLQQDHAAGPHRSAISESLSHATSVTSEGSLRSTLHHASRTHRNTVAGIQHRSGVSEIAGLANNSVLPDGHLRSSEHSDESTLANTQLSGPVTTLRAIDDARVVEPAAVTQNPLHINATPLSGTARSGFQTWASMEGKLRMLPTVTLSSGARDQNIVTLSGLKLSPAYWLGADREIADGWTAGVRLGVVPTGQLQSVTYSEPTPGYPLLRRYKRETRITDTTSYAYGLGVGRTFHPTEPIDLTASLYGGSGSAALKWFAGTTVTANYSMTSKLGAWVSGGFDVFSTKPAGSGGEPLPSSFTLGVQDLGSTPSTLLTPAFNISIGIRFQP